ncbi:MAG: hypothetical protein H8E66_34785 [Planctomycetes bacterium]|nr:hypothetical protein [Planctomycetota bacterium]
MLRNRSAGLHGGVGDLLASFAYSIGELKRTQGIVDFARRRGLRVRRPLIGMQAGLDDAGEVVLDIGYIVHSTVALEEYLHGQYLRTLVRRVGTGHTRAWLDDALQTLPHELELKCARPNCGRTFCRIVGV